MARGAGNYRRFTDAEKAAMARQRREGKSYAEIAHAMGEPTKRVGDWFRLSRDAPDDRPQRLPPRWVASLPTATGGSLKPPTLAQLMGRR